MSNIHVRIEWDSETEDEDDALMSIESAVEDMARNLVNVGTLDTVENVEVIVE